MLKLQQIKVPGISVYGSRHCSSPARPLCRRAAGGFCKGQSREEELYGSCTSRMQPQWQIQNWSCMSFCPDGAITCPSVPSNAANKACAYTMFFIPSAPPRLSAVNGFF
ncbi:hypothetical protein M752DRAFT_45671 [Aspergillus phoenicis ATCC 13157]|uniref:Uncharacterized protein n=1 Tax=Aspergillus phoenicis ATCC 13157 TaxID=1353007 RepID=A0A370PCH2_ASPPH|nr:hypothetical protein M752DRAFT_45671 [Aspergillus phoenicis ATCC 13157]